MGILLDLLLVVMLVASVFSGLKMGFVRGVIGIVGWIAAIAIAASLSSAISEPIYKNHFRQPIVNSVQKNMDEYIVNIENEASAKKDELLNLIPAGFKGLLSQAGITDEKITGSINWTNSSAADLAPQFVDLAFKPIIVAAIRVVSFLILFIILSVAVSIVGKLVGGTILSKIPIVGSMNSALGGALGLIKGLIAIYIFCFMLKALTPVIGNSIPVFNQDAYNNSRLVKAISDIQIVKLESLIGKQ